jgi:hypothetical protein
MTTTISGRRALALATMFLGLGVCRAAAGQTAMVTAIPTPDTAAVRDVIGAVSLSGDVLAIGDVGFGVFVYARSGATFVYQTTLKPSPTPPSTAFPFGSAVAVSGSRIVVGAPQEMNGSGVATGAVYVFEGAQATWTQTARLTPADGASNDRFGSALALSGDRLVVSASNHGAYVFDDVSGAWVQTTELPAAGPVAMDGGWVVVGTTVFACSATACTQNATLTDPQPSQGAPIAFGASVAISGQIAVVGAPNVLGELFGGVDGHAVVYELQGGTWQPTVVWAAPGGVAGFGTSVAVGPTGAVVAGPTNSDIIGPGFPGKALFYARTASGWAPPVVLNPQLPPPTNPTSEMDMDFGLSVALEDNIVIGAPVETGWNGSTGTGTAVMFTITPPPVPALGPLALGVAGLALLALGARAAGGPRRRR